MTTENATTTTGSDTTEPDTGQVDTPDTDTGVAAPDTAEAEPEPDVFPRQVVEDLRRENGRYRQRAQQADTLATRLHTELVRATGRLADPTDLPFDAAHLDDPDALATALDGLLAAKPHLAARRVAGDVGQGQRGPAAGSFSLLDTLKGLA